MLKYLMIENDVKLKKKDKVLVKILYKSLKNFNQFFFDEKDDKSWKIVVKKLAKLKLIQ